MEVRTSNWLTNTSRVQQLLRISYAHVQMMIYRPFIHYVSSSCQSKNVDKRSFACAAACISVARNIVHITSEMKRRGLLVGSYWFVMYTTYFAILSLVFFVIENPNSPTGQDILKDAVEGRDTLASLAKRSMAADRCTASLAVGTPKSTLPWPTNMVQGLFDVLPEKLKEKRSSLKTTPSTARKRPPPTTTADDTHTTPQNIPTPSSLRENMSTPLRARTFPSDFLAKLAKRNSMPDSNIFTNFGEGANHVPQIVGFASPSAASPMSAAFDFTPQMGNAQLPDLKNVMFPSDNPFAYPNQPISTLESGDGQYSFQDQGIDSYGGTGEHNMYDTPQSGSQGSMQPLPTSAPNFDLSYHQALNEPSGLTNPYGGQGGQFGTPLTDMLMQNAIGTEAGHFGTWQGQGRGQGQGQGQVQSHGPMGMGDLNGENLDTASSDERYWEGLHKSEMGSLKSGYAPMGDTNGINNGGGTNDMFGSDPWMPSWEQTYATNPQ